MFKYFEKYSSPDKTTYYCQIDGWNYCGAEYHIYRDYREEFITCFYDYIEIDWKEWGKEELPNELKILPENVMREIINFIYS